MSIKVNILVVMVASIQNPIKSPEEVNLRNFEEEL